MTEHVGRGRGRPLGFDPDAVIHELVLLFWEKGYNATTQADMVKRTGLSSSSLYNTFGDKPAIFDRVLARYNEMTASACEPMMTGSDGLAELEAFLARREAHLSQPVSGPAGCLMVNAMSEVAGSEAEVRQRCDDYRAIQREALLVALDRAVAQGDLAPGDNRIRSALLLAANIGVGATARSTDSTDDTLAMVRGMRQLIRSWAVHPDSEPQGAGPNTS